MLQAACDATTTTTTAAAATTTTTTGATDHNNSTVVATPEEKSQRRRSTFYVPLVIEDEAEEEVVVVEGGGGGGGGAAEKASKDLPPSQPQKSASNSSLSSSSETRSARNYSLRKSGSSVARSGVARINALFERKSSQKMSPPCGFNWSISGSEQAGQYSDSDEDEENSSEARHREQLLKSLPISTSAGSTSSPSSKLKRYGIVLNVISLNGSDGELALPPGSLVPPTPAPRTHFNEDNDIVLATPPKQKATVITADYEDESEISRMQTNTSTPIKLMKSRSRTNILAVPLPSVERGLASSPSHKSVTSTTPAATTTTMTTTTTTTTTTTITLRAKSKTLPQNLSPSVVLREAAALDELERKRDRNGNRDKHDNRENRDKQRHLFGSGLVSGGGSPYKLQNSTSATSILTHSFPPKNLFLLKSTPKLSPEIATPITTTTTTITSPPKKSLSFIRRAHSTKVSRSNSLLKSGQNSGPAAGAGCGLAGGIPSGGAMHHQGSLSSCAGGGGGGGGSDSSSGYGSWGKHFYQPYDVCPLSLDELNCYFQADHCEELICERFKIKATYLTTTSASASVSVSEAGADLSVNETTDSTATVTGPAEEDAGHHSGRWLLVTGVQTCTSSSPTPSNPQLQSFGKTNTKQPLLLIPIPIRFDRTIPRLSYNGFYVSGTTIALALVGIPLSGGSR